MGYLIIGFWTSIKVKFSCRNIKYLIIKNISRQAGAELWQRLFVGAGVEVEVGIEIGVEIRYGVQLLLAWWVGGG